MQLKIENIGTFNETPIARPFKVLL